MCVYSAKWEEDLLIIDSRSAEVQSALKHQPGPQKDRHSLLKIPGNLHIIKVAIKSAATIWREKRENRDISNSPNITDSSEKMSYCRNL